MQYMRRAVYPVNLISVCLSQAGVLSKHLNGLNWFLAQRPPSAYSTLCCEVSPKIGVPPSRTLSQSLNLADFLLFCHVMSAIASVVLST